MRPVKFAVVAVVLLLGVAESANAQKTDSFRKFRLPENHLLEKQPHRVGQRMAAHMLNAMPRFKGLSHDSAAVLLIRQSKHHIIVMSQCDFELRLSRQNASPAWQELSDSVARDTRRVVIRNERLTTAEINDVLNRAARMARFCMSAGAGF